MFELDRCPKVAGGADAEDAVEEAWGSAGYSRELPTGGGGGMVDLDESATVAYDAFAGAAGIAGAALCPPALHVPGVTVPPFDVTDGGGPLNPIGGGPPSTKGLTT